ncbi:MAG: PQQ-dependent sugar dehydrogenase [Bdellovibrionota bacterium]
MNSTLSNRVFWIAALLAVLCLSGEAFAKRKKKAEPEGGKKLVKAFPNLPALSEPVALVQMPGDSRWWHAVERGGLVRRFDAKPDARRLTTAIDLTDRVDASAQETGLLGMAFHPNFSKNFYVYLSYTARSKGKYQSRVSRFTSLDRGQTFAPSSEEILFTRQQPYSNHNGGGIGFGPDGYLYIGLGDGGSAGDPHGNGQNPDTILGKMLRIDVNKKDAACEKPYGIPEENPFAKAPCPEGEDDKRMVYALGLRNPWRWSFDRETGSLWVADVGQNLWEEIDVVEMGKNYGWNVREGAHCFDAKECKSDGFVGPVAEYPHSNDSGFQGCSVTGGYVYRGKKSPEYAGIYFYGDFCTGNIWGLLDPYGKKKVKLLYPKTDVGISSFAEGNDGELYVLDFKRGTVLRVTGK